VPEIRWIALGCIALAVAGRLAAADDTSPAVANVPHCFVVLAEQADLPPQEAGVIQEIAAVEGQQVAEKQLLLQLDDRKAQREQEVAEAKYDAAKAKAQDDINIRYAVAAAAVAKAEYEVNKKANADVPGSVPQVRLNELYLKCKETELAIEKARLDRSIAAEEAKVAKAEVEAAKVTVDRHKVLSPIAGVVVDLRAHKGEAVQPSQAVIHVVKLDSLWVEGNASAARFARAELEKRPVTVDVVITRGEKISLPGEIIFVKPLTDTGDTYMVRAKVENRKVNGSWLLSPGMQAEMNIQLK
jgi:multidrug efflux pump subunit AcrA (membrane-fusion protein)